MLGKRRKTWYLSRRDYTLQQQPTYHNIAPIKSILYYCSSLGEYERIKPVVAHLAQKVLHQEICFFSDSGYRYAKSDTTENISFSYAPLDIRENIELFFKARRTQAVIISSNTIWPNFLKYLYRHDIPYLYAGSSFYPSSSLKKWSHLWFFTLLQRAQHIAVIDHDTSVYLQSLGDLSNVVVAGDPRIDQITKTSTDKEFVNMKNWIAGSKLLICGSTHLSDEKILKSLINDIARENWKIIIAPHESNNYNTERISGEFNDSILYSNLDDHYNRLICILDQHGILKQLYQYADYTYIGGGFGEGIHNIMEPIIAGSKVGFGPKFEKFPEARFLVSKNACNIITTSKDLRKAIDKPINSKTKRVIEEYISLQSGAAKKIKELIDRLGIYN